METGARK